ncbi:unnamed protein product, partial [Effrenium voratum]
MLLPNGPGVRHANAQLVAHPPSARSEKRPGGAGGAGGAGATGCRVACAAGLWMASRRTSQRATAVDPPVDRVEVEEVTPKEAEEKQNYSWDQQWYPVLPLSMLEGSGPEPIKLLNRDLVLWKDDSGEWVCTGGICPHRLAPLARGRVQNGQLMCRFHGWCFKGDGLCAKVPMAEGDDKAEKRLIGTACSKLDLYPTKVRKGLLFVWPHADSAAAARSEPFVAEELSESPNWSVFDAPASWRVWLEQSWDPSHAPFLHQYALPNFSPELAYPMEPFQVEDLGDEGLSAVHGGYMQSNKGMTAQRRFAPPCANSTSYLYPDGRIVGFNFYFVPLEEGKVRQITTSYFVPSPQQASQKSNLSGNMMQMSKVVLKGRTVGSTDQPKESLVVSLKRRACEKWPELGRIRRGLKIQQLLQGLIGDQDNTVLSFQDSVGLPAVRSGRLRQPQVSQRCPPTKFSPKSSWRYGGPATEYLLETPADELVARFGSWVQQRGGGPFGRKEGGEGVTPAAGVFDRWQAHTCFGRDAQAALGFLTRLG